MWSMDGRLPPTFWRNVAIDAATGCWNWTRKTQHSSGYGRVKVGGMFKKAHRVSWEAVNGEVPKGLHLDHLCRNRACVNPAHLEPVVPAENNRRALVAKSSATGCPNGMQVAPGEIHTKKRCPACVAAWNASRRSARPNVLVNKRHRKPKLTKEGVAEARRRNAAGESQALLAAEFGVSRSSMSYAIRGITWGESLEKESP